MAVAVAVSVSYGMCEKDILFVTYTKSIPLMLICAVYALCAPRTIFNSKQTASARNKWEQHKQWHSIDFILATTNNKQQAAQQQQQQ